MIRIKIDPNKQKELEEIHWNWFKARMKEIAWPQNTTHKEFILKNVFFLNTAEKKLSPDKQDIIKENRLRMLIAGNPNTKINGVKLYDFFYQLNKKYKWHNTGKMAQKENETEQEFNERKKKAEDENKRTKDLQKAFGYNDFVSSPQKENWYKNFKKSNNGNDWNAKVLSEELSIDVCPYCNRQYIFGYDLIDNETVANKKNTAEIDHFKPKGYFPYFSCSLYNFVPSCHLCNSTKQAQDKDILYPYTDSLDENTKNEKNAKFKFNANGIKLEVNPNYSKATEADNSIKMFHLNEIYSKHTLELNDLTKRYEKCTPQQFNALFNFITKDLQISISKENLKKLMMGLPISTTKEYPLRKFKEDIINQLEEESKKIVK